jgi:WD40 repeat protein
VTGSTDTNIKVWDLRMKSNQNVLTFKEHSGPVNCLALSPDARWVASGGDDGALKIWDITSGKV